MVVQIELPKNAKLVCGTKCIFCRFDFADDSYHCVFFDNDPEDIFVVNLAAEERRRYTSCPVEVVDNGNT